ncbi:MAG TPA: fumarylacetoacetate hydrolase family protein [Gaiellaceae bacterium]|nr:fumarylacetoacetate hydrolase family protein [Gaiellaceae bacterium]
MRAVRYSAGGEARVGRLEEDHVVDAGPAGFRGFDCSDEAWELVANATGEQHALDAVRLLHPCEPQKILGIGLNYASHVEETSLQRPEVPFCFAIWPSSLIGHEEAIVIPREETRPDWEGEVAVILGRRVRRADRAAARAAIGGIAAVNDVSGRRAQLETPMRQFTLGKSLDTFTPLGPCVTHPDALDLGRIGVRTTLNGEVVQESDTSHLIFDFEALIEYFSQQVTLEPADVIATGTPGGVGDERKPPWYLKDGDLVEVTVDGVGTLRNPVRAER